MMPKATIIRVAQNQSSVSRRRTRPLRAAVCPASNTRFIKPPGCALQPKAERGGRQSQIAVVRRFAAL